MARHVLVWHHRADPVLEGTYTRTTTWSFSSKKQANEIASALLGHPRTIAVGMRDQKLVDKFRKVL